MAYLKRARLIPEIGPGGRSSSEAGLAPSSRLDPEAYPAWQAEEDEPYELVGVHAAGRPPRPPFMEQLDALDRASRP
jgi:hypothetical protein